jgi:hypothetical protein
MVIGFENAGFGARFLPSGLASVDLVAMVVLLDVCETGLGENRPPEGLNHTCGTV